MADPTTDRDLDIVVYGATGFVGRLVAGYLARRADPALRIGLGGRSQARLAAVRGELPSPAAQWPLIVADAHDSAALEAMVHRTRVVATTVGPYARHGLPLVQACAAAGTDYADLTGEVLFVRDSIDRCHDTAQRSGARVVHACGFDSIPSDLGVWALSDRARRDGEGTLTDTTLVLRSARGDVSGGTLDSLRVQIDEVRRDPSARRTVADPHALSPDRDAEPEPAPDSFAVRRDPALGQWTGPFAMSLYNTRIVRRSNALLDWAYGREFTYRERMGFGTGPLAPALAGAMTLGLGAATAAMVFPPSRMLLDRVLRSPGEGPSEATRRKGHFRVDIHTTTTTGARYRAVVAAQGDPGYAATSVMLGESALCLAGDRDRLPARAGVLTPATAMDGALVERLRRADFRIEVDRA